MEQDTSNILEENSQDQTVESSDIQSDIFEQVFSKNGQDPFSTNEVIQEET